MASSSSYILPSIYLSEGSYVITMSKRNNKLHAKDRKSLFSVLFNFAVTALYFLAKTVYI